MICTVLFSLLFFSCKKEFKVDENKYLNSPQASLAPIPSISECGNVTNSNGILVFENETKMGIALQALTAMTEAERQNWEKQHGFISLRTKFEKVVKAEYEKLIAPYEALNVSTIEGMPFPGHSDEYNAAVAENLITVSIDANGIESYEMTEKAGYLSYIANSEGYVFAKNKLFLIQGDKIKTMENATLSDLNSLKLVMGDNDGIGVEVKTFGKKSRATVDYSQFPPWVTVGNNQVLLEVYYEMDYISNMEIKIRNCTFHTVAKRRSWGKWINNPGTHYVYWSAYCSFAVYDNSISSRYFLSNPAFVNGQTPPNTNLGYLYAQNASGGDAWQTVASNAYFQAPFGKVVNGILLAVDIPFNIVVMHRYLEVVVGFPLVLIHLLGHYNIFWNDQ